MSSKVYFTKDISPEGVVKVYRALGTEIGGRVAVKVHSGEKGNQNFLTPDFWKPMIDAVGGTVVDGTVVGLVAGAVVMGSVVGSVGFCRVSSSSGGRSPRSKTQVRVAVSSHSQREEAKLR